MKDAMSSRERLLTAIGHEEPDRVPICFRDVAPFEHLWSDPFERVLVLRDMGVDDKLFVHPPRGAAHDVTVPGIGALYTVYGTDIWPFHPDVTVQDWADDTADDRYTIVYKEINTPEGPLRMGARRTDDWNVRALPLVADHLWSRGVEFLVKGPEDLDKVRYLFSGGTDAFFEEARIVKDFAAKHGVLVEGDVNAVSNIALSLRGPTNLMCDAAGGSALIDEFLDIISAWNLRRLELMLEAGVDTIYHTACYETTAFWSPEMYRRYFRPHLEKKLALMHQADVKMHYYMDIGIAPLLGDFREMGIDILSTVDPAPYGDADIGKLKREVGDTICLWGGVDAPHTIEGGTAGDVEKAVRQAIAAAAPGGGFVLSTADSVWDVKAYDTVMAFIRAGLEFGRYPIAL